MQKLAAALALGLLAAASAHAQERPPANDEGRGVVTFLAGAAAAFGLHETGHVIAALAFDARPRVKRISYGALPFFAIDHAGVTRRREFTISSSGLWVQHAGSEWILTTRPDLRHERAPFLKGVLVFNLAASTVYGVAALGHLGPPESDTYGMASSLGRDGVNESWVGAIVLAPAVLDAYRYWRPGSAWATWASRSAKVAAVLLVFAAREDGAGGR